jgi:hypothetical protein
MARKQNGTTTTETKPSAADRYKARRSEKRPTITVATIMAAVDPDTGAPYTEEDATDLLAMYGEMTAGEKSGFSKFVKAQTPGSDDDAADGAGK